MTEETQGITAITVGGYKSIRDETTIEIRPLTILAGANSSGKSSIMQPMLMMKQTLNENHDPGPLTLDGPHVEFTNVEQFRPKTLLGGKHVLTAGYRFAHEFGLKCKFGFTAAEEEMRKIELLGMTIISPQVGSVEVTLDMPEEEVIELASKELPFAPDVLLRAFRRDISGKGEKFEFGWGVSSSRCFLRLGLIEKNRDFRIPLLPMDPVPDVQSIIENLIHVPGLRGNPRRTYRITSAEPPEFPGPFHPYTASIISRFQNEEQREKIEWIERYLRDFNLTGWVEASRINDANVELMVGRPPVSSNIDSREDSVNIADVGFGVSQVLPVLVALAVAEPGQMVYIEQPELHLHPRAQVAMASVLADAAKRDVRVVIETHSSLLLQGVLTLIAQDELDHKDVMLHWFNRDDEGNTIVNSEEPDENGAYGEWPEDFGDVELGIQGKYLHALADREFGEAM